MIDESMQSGRSQKPWTSGTACAISPTSSASGSPTLTSSMSAPPATWSATSVSSCERSPAWSCAWNALRPVGLMRSPITQNGCSGPMTTVLDGDRTTVSTHLPLFAGGYAQARAEPGDARLAPEADQVQARDAGERARVLRELARDLEARLLGIGRALAALDRLRGDEDAGHVLVDVAQRIRRASEADRRDQRAPFREARAHGLGHEAGEALRLEADLELQEARARAHLLVRTRDAVVVRRRSRVLDGSEE